MDRGRAIGVRIGQQDVKEEDAPGIWGVLGSNRHSPVVLEQSLSHIRHI